MPAGYAEKFDRSHRPAADESTTLSAPSPVIKERQTDYQRQRDGDRPTITRQKRRAGHTVDMSPVERHRFRHVNGKFMGRRVLARVRAGAAVMI